MDKILNDILDYKTLSASKKGSDVFVKVLDVKTVEHWGKASKLSAIALYNAIRICLEAF